MSRYLSLYRYFVVQRFKILMEYRLNFFIGATSTAVLQAASLTTLWVVMRQIPSLNGWNFYEVLLIYGLLTMGESITHMFADNLWTIGWNYIRSGDFDRFLVRPIDPLFHLLADRFCHDGIGNFVTGLVLVGIAMRELHIAITPLRGAYILVAVLSGGFIFIALNLITATSAFWLTEIDPRHADRVQHERVRQVPAQHLSRRDPHPADMADPVWLCLVLSGPLPARSRRGADGLAEPGGRSSFPAGSLPCLVVWIAPLLQHRLLMSRRRSRRGAIRRRSRAFFVFPPVFFQTTGLDPSG